jgi:hypothetical protein
LLDTAEQERRQRLMMVANNMNRNIEPTRDTFPPHESAGPIWLERAQI